MPSDSLTDPLRLRAALMLACMKIEKNPDKAVALQERLYDAVKGFETDLDKFDKLMTDALKGKLP